VRTANTVFQATNTSLTCTSCLHQLIQTAQTPVMQSVHPATHQDIRCCCKLVLLVRVHMIECDCPSVLKPCISVQLLVLWCGPVHQPFPGGPSSGPRDPAQEDADHSGQSHFPGQRRAQAAGRRLWTRPVKGWCSFHHSHNWGRRSAAPQLGQPHRDRCRHNVRGPPASLGAEARP
jgi:hypothetical protein